MIADRCLFNPNGLFSDDRYNRLGAVGLFRHECRRDLVVYETETSQIRTRCPAWDCRPQFSNAFISSCQESVTLRVSSGSHISAGNANRSREATKLSLAEGVGFEPTVRLPARRFSRPLL
jgi:hypothetical protein